MKDKKFLMTEGTIWKILVKFAFPLFLGGLFQQLYNAADSFVVGKFCGDDALAAVSSSGSLCFLLIGFFQGVFMGGSVVISNRYGADDKEGVDKAIHTLVVFSLCIGAALSVLGVIFTPTILRLMGTPENIMPNSVLYFRIYCSGLMALVLYNTATGIFQSLGDSKHPLYYLIIASVANIILDLLFVAVFKMGVAGAALATVLGQLLSAVLAFGYLISGKFIVKIQIKKLKADKDVFKKVIKLGLPGGVQNSVIALANVVVQSNINAFGHNAMAGCGSYFKIEGFVFIPIMSVTMAMTTFIGQNLGANNKERAIKGGRTGLFMTVLFSEIVGVTFFLTAPYLIRLFSNTPEVLEYGIRQAKVETLFYCFLGFSHGCAAILRGTGRTMSPMVVMLSVWCVFRIFYITIMVHYFNNIVVVFSAYPVTWFLSSVILFVAVKKIDWSKNKMQLNSENKE